MENKQSEQASPADSGYELDLDDTISAWDHVVQEAVKAVDKTEEARETPVAAAQDEAAEVSAEAASAPVAESPEEDVAAEPVVAEEKAVEPVVAEEKAAEPVVAEEKAAEPVVAEEKAAEEKAAEEKAAEEKAAEEKAAEAAADSAEDEKDDTEVKNLREQLLRTLADFDNFRKRAEREKASMKRYALFNALKDFLDVHDNLDRALAASGSAEDLKMGVEMISRQLMELLGRYGVEPVEAVGKAFDPIVHEAVLREEGAEIEEPTVITEFQRGYRFHDRLLRPAMVSVAMPAPLCEENDNDEAEESQESQSEASQAASESSQSGETQSGETQSGETQSGETQSGETQSGETQSGETQSGETQSGETQSGETQSGETQSGESQPDERENEEELGKTVAQTS